MFPFTRKKERLPIFPYSFALVSTQAALRLHNEQILNLLRFHSSGVWGSISTEAKDINLANIKNKRSIVLSHHLYNEGRFIIKTLFDLSEEDYRIFLKPNLNYDMVDCLTWDGWPSRIVTVIEVAP